MKFCPSCGAKLDNDNFKFCPECGYKFGADTNNSNKEKSGGFISSFIKGIRNEIPDGYVDKIKDNETIDDAITHAKIIWHGPQSEKEKAYKERKRQEKEAKDPIKYKISEVTGKHLSESPYFTERKKLFNVSDGYTYYKDILKWEADNYDLKYDDIEARLDELLKINSAQTIFELRFKHPTCLFKTREDLKNYIGHGTAKAPIPFTDEEIEKRKRDLDFEAALKNIPSKETDKKDANKIINTKPVDNNINQEIEKPKVISATTTSKKENLTNQKTDDPNYADFGLSELEESLIKSLPLIDNPSEYEENIITKYAEYNSAERKELLKDCWTITKLAEEHSINRKEVQNTILTDEFLEKDLIGVFKVNPKNIRSLKILYRKPLNETQQKQKTKNLATNDEIIGEVYEIPKESVAKDPVLKETEVEPIDEKETGNSPTDDEVVEEETETVVDEIVEENKTPVDDEVVEEETETVVDEIVEENKTPVDDEIIGQVQTTEEEQVEIEEVGEKVVEEEKEALKEVSVEKSIVEKDVKTSNENNVDVSTKAKKDKEYFMKKPKKDKKKGLFSKKTPEEKEFDEKLKYYVGGVSSSKYYLKKAKEHGKIITQVNPIHVKKILKDEFEYGTLSVNDMEQRIDELMELDITCIRHDILDKGYDTSLIKTPEDIQDFLEVVFEGKSDQSFNKEYRQKVLFEKYGINTDEAYCFRCAIEEKRSHTFGNETYRKPSQAFIALFDDYIAIAKESAILQSDLGIRKVFFRNVASIDYDARGKVSLTNHLFINLKSAESVQLYNISEKDVAEVQTRFENYMAEKDTPNTVQIKQETSNADELLKYAELYKQGLLSEEEFEAKKKELL